MFPNHFNDKYDSLLQSMFRWGEEGSGSIEVDSAGRVSSFFYSFWQKHNEPKDQRLHGIMRKKAALALKELVQKLGNPKMSGADTDRWVSYTWKNPHYLYKLTVSRMDDTSETQFDFKAERRKPKIHFVPKPITMFPVFLKKTRSEAHAMLTQLHVEYYDTTITITGEKPHDDIFLPDFTLWGIECSARIYLDSTDHIVFQSFNIGENYPETGGKYTMNNPHLSAVNYERRMQINHDMNAQFGKSTIDPKLEGFLIWKDRTNIYEVGGLNLDDQDEDYIVVISAFTKKMQ